MGILRALLCGVAVCSRHCFASRDPTPTPTSLDLQPSILEEHAVAVRKELPSFEELNKFIAEEGPLAKTLKVADSDAEELATSAKEWSENSKAIAEPLYQAVAIAEEDGSDLKKATEKEESQAEAGIESLIKKSLEEEEENDDKIAEAEGETSTAEVSKDAAGKEEHRGVDIFHTEDVDDSVRDEKKGVIANTAVHRREDIDDSVRDEKEGVIANTADHRREDIDDSVQDETKGVNDSGPNENHELKPQLHESNHPDTTADSSTKKIPASMMELKHQDHGHSLETVPTGESHPDTSVNVGMENIIPLKVTNDRGQTIIRLKHPSGAMCEIYLFGATITKFVTASGRDVLWVSSNAKLDGTKAIRGGIPLVFPQFGTPIEGMAQHGFARNNLWTLEGVEGTEDPRCVFSLDNKVATHEAWPHPYRLEYSVTLGAETLATTLTVHNVGEQPFEFMDLQHTYINVGDVLHTSVSGLQGVQYFDKTSEDPEKACTDERQAANVGEFTDRIYFPTKSKPIPDPVKIVSPLGSISVSKKATATTEDGTIELPVDTVLWNPWAEKAAGMADFEKDGYLRMLCVEPGLVKGFQTLSPKASASLTQVLSTTI